MQPYQMDHSGTRESRWRGLGQARSVIAPRIHTWLLFHINGHYSGRTAGAVHFKIRAHAATL